MSISLEEHEKNLYSTKPELIKSALDFYTENTGKAAGHINRIKDLKQYAAFNEGRDAILVEVAAIILWNQINQHLAK